MKIHIDGYLLTLTKQSNPLHLFCLIGGDYVQCQVTMYNLDGGIHYYNSTSVQAYRVICVLQIKHTNSIIKYRLSWENAVSCINYIKPYHSISSITSHSTKYAYRHLH